MSESTVTTVTAARGTKTAPASKLAASITSTTSAVSATSKGRTAAKAERAEDCLQFLIGTVLGASLIAAACLIRAWTLTLLCSLTGLTHRTLPAAFTLAERGKWIA
jgi:nucleoside recognition membrane protein YjiH